VSGVLFVMPLKIFKSTKFIKDVLTSALEVAKFEDAAIHTVSRKSEGR
jgi:ribosome biogenesis protein BMS1